jgi:hypothetical protein
VTLSDFDALDLKSTALAIGEKLNLKCGLSFCVCHTSSNFKGFNKTHSEMAMCCFLNQHWKEIANIIVK